jgi:hypothetical protein
VISILSALQIHEINTFKGFFDLKEQWNNLLEKTNDNLATLTWEHIYVSVKNLGAEKSLRIITITRGDKIIAIAPLRTARYKLGFLKYKVIEPLDYENATDYTGFIISEHKLECLRMFLTYLSRQKDWVYLNINDTPETSTLFQLIKSDSDFLPKFFIEKGDLCPYIAVPNSMEEFLNNLRLHHKKELGRCFRRLERDYGKVELKEYHELGTLEHAINLFFSLHQKRWESQGGKGAFNSQKIREIFLERAKLFAQNNWLGLYFLTVNDKPVAGNYALKYNKKVHSCSSGFDTDYYPYSVSNLLLTKIMEQCIQEGFTEYDFMKGSESYKFKWTSRYRSNFRIKLINKKYTSHLITLGERLKKQRWIWPNLLLSYCSLIVSIFLTASQFLAFDTIFLTGL